MHFDYGTVSITLIYNSIETFTYDFVAIQNDPSLTFCAIPCVVGLSNYKFYYPKNNAA